MYALQKLAIKMAPHIIANPTTAIPAALVIGGIALICEALD